MRDSFMSIVSEQHQKGKTILMSSHMFDELEAYSDKVGLIMNGKILDIANMEEIRNANFKLYKIEFENQLDYENFMNLNKYECVRNQAAYNQTTLRIKNGQVKNLMIDLSSYKVRFMREVKYNLEKYFKEKLELEK